MINKITVKELMKKPTKELVVKLYIEFIRMNGRVNFSYKLAWIFIGTLITGFIGGGIALIFYFARVVM